MFVLGCVEKKDAIDNDDDDDDAELLLLWLSYRFHQCNQRNTHTDNCKVANRYTKILTEGRWANGTN